MIAKYSGQCKTCRGSIAPGAAIRMIAQGAVHAGCFHVAVLSGDHQRRRSVDSDDGYDMQRDAYLTGESGYDPRGRYDR